MITFLQVKKSWNYLFDSNILRLQLQQRSESAIPVLFLTYNFKIPCNVIILFKSIQETVCVVETLFLSNFKHFPDIVVYCSLHYLFANIQYTAMKLHPASVTFNEWKRTNIQLYVYMSRFPAKWMFHCRSYKLWFQVYFLKWRGSEHQLRTGLFFSSLSREQLNHTVTTAQDLEYNVTLSTLLALLRTLFHFPTIVFKEKERIKHGFFFTTPCLYEDLFLCTLFLLNKSLNDYQK